MKKILGIGLAGFVLLVVFLVVDLNSEEKTVDQVVGEVFQKYDVESVHVELESPTIHVDVNNLDDENDIRSFIEKNLTKEDRDTYKVETYTTREPQ